MEAKTFREAYDVLQRHAETLRTQGEPNIDDLLDIVNESVSAYKVCKQRIDAVEKALEEALGGAGIDGSSRVTSKASASGSQGPDPAPPRRPDKPAARTGFEEMDDDIPF